MRRFYHVNEEQCDGSCWKILRFAQGDITSLLIIQCIEFAARCLLHLGLPWQQAQLAGALAKEFTEFLYIVGTRPGGAAFPARNIEIEGSTNLISDILLRPASFLPGLA